MISAILFLSFSWFIIGAFLIVGMALIKFGHLISEARGKLNGTVFSRNTYGAYMRTKVTPSNPGTNFQTSIRSYLTAASKHWREISDAYRLGWESLAKELSRTNVFGDNVPLTGFNCFVRLNVNRQLIGKTILDIAPVATPPGSLTSISIATLTSAVMTVAFGPSPVPTKNHLILFCTPSVSKGKSFVKSEYRMLKVYAPAQATPINCYADYSARFGAPVTGKKVFVKAFQIYEDSGIPSGFLSAVKDVG